MRKCRFLLLLLFTVSCSTYVKKDPDFQPAAELIYIVNLNDRADDTFKVKLFVNNLRDENAIYQFAASAPGTYQTMDLGRFVRDFKSYDAGGNEISTSRISTNQWQISQPENVYSIEYRIAETFDTPIDSNNIYPMAGSSLEVDHALINGQCVFGYPTGMQKRSAKIKLRYPADWIIGTALNLDSDSFYVANDYDQIVDSPILAGNLSRANTNVGETKVEVFVYSQKGLVEADVILTEAHNMLNAAAAFTDGLPVDRYSFLLYFEDNVFVGAGAWEHNFSSTYTFSETPIAANPGFLVQIMAHEFFHIITPLNIHSELVEHFNYVNPQPSEHLWLYEATTEWAAQIMQLRGGLMDLDQYLKVITGKLTVADSYRKDYSLSELSLNSFSSTGKDQYINVYQKGAVIIGLMDILMLDLSDGTRGMREVINELSDIYGPQKAFDEKTFFKTFTDFTYPQVGEFLDNYIKKAEPLPVADYFSRIGINYLEAQKTNETDTLGGFGIGYNDGTFVFSPVDSLTVIQGLADGDILIEMNDEVVNAENIGRLFAEFKALTADQPYKLKVRRGTELVELTLKKITKPKVLKHIFTVDENAGEEQLKLRDAWIKNL